MSSQETTLRKDSGVLLALGREDAKQLFASREDAALRQFVQSWWSAHRAGADVCELGAHWKDLHAQLVAAGKRTGEPLEQVILGGRPLHRGGDFHVVLVRPDLVPHLAAALASLAAEDPPLADHPAATVPVEADAGRPSPGAELHGRVRAFYQAAARQGCCVVFAAAQDAAAPDSP